MPGPVSEKRTTTLQKENDELKMKNTNDEEKLNALSGEVSELKSQLEKLEKQLKQ